MAKEYEITDDNFATEVEASETPVLVDFWAPWCAPCKMVAPIVEEIASEYEGKLKVGKLNTDENPQVPTKFGIMGIPTLMIFKNGKVVERIVGALGKGALTTKIDAVLE
jgi:thioredoxin 1